MRGPARPSRRRSSRSTSLRKATSSERSPRSTRRALAVFGALSQLRVVRRGSARVPDCAIGASSRISASRRTGKRAASSPSRDPPSAGEKKVTLIRGRFGKRTMSTVPVTVTETIAASGTATASRPSAAASAQHRAARDRALGKDADARPSRTGGSPRRERLGRGPSLDRNLTHSPQDRREAAGCPTGSPSRARGSACAFARPCRSRPGPTASRDCRRSARDRMSAPTPRLDLQPAPPADDRRADRHDEAVGAGDWLGVHRVWTLRGAHHKAPLLGKANGPGAEPGPLNVRSRRASSSR